MACFSFDMIQVTVKEKEKPINICANCYEGEEKHKCSFCGRFFSKQGCVPYDGLNAGKCLGPNTDRSKPVDLGDTRRELIEKRACALFETAANCIVSARDVLSGIEQTPIEQAKEDLFTKGRFARAFLEMFSGYGSNPVDEISKCVFWSKELPQVQQRHVVWHDTILFESCIPFSSTCSHHILPFYGTISMAVIPRYYNEQRRSKLIGLSKIKRAVDIVSSRLTNQEDLVAELVEAVYLSDAKPVAVFATAKAKHMCKIVRGVKNHNSEYFVYKELFDTDERNYSRIIKVARNKMVSLCGFRSFSDGDC